MRVLCYVTPGRMDSANVLFDGGKEGGLSWTGMVKAHTPTCNQSITSMTMTTPTATTITTTTITLMAPQRTCAGTLHVTDHAPATWRSSSTSTRVLHLPAAPSATFRCLSSPPADAVNTSSSECITLFGIFPSRLSYHILALDRHISLLLLFLLWGQLPLPLVYTTCFPVLCSRSWTPSPLHLHLGPHQVYIMYPKHVPTASQMYVVWISPHHL